MKNIADELRTARKRHVCDLCWRIIETGEKYRHQRNAADGDIWTYRQCVHCEPLVRALVDDCGWWSDSINIDTVSEWEPSTIAYMRLKVGWKRRWRKSDGSLYPVPAVTE